MFQVLVLIHSGEALMLKLSSLYSSYSGNNKSNPYQLKYIPNIHVSLPHQHRDRQILTFRFVIPSRNVLTCQQFFTKYNSILREIFSRLLKEIVQTVHKKRQNSQKGLPKMFSTKKTCRSNWYVNMNAKEHCWSDKYILWEGGIKEWM